ncbi:CRAL-TRIO domain-containing protein [Zychaea mexicana]|uniref:CRAL-TRIO domain-containing protein n=1 Tax=Zychaea mexicana TaxID=64656 RepID=UPI0022FE3548|nr:CRAL-TRIO domain-containing protein [Zychaea mexicana]KAI9476634.1 CRAL-TRIO domain-containing protein [Zychaea mexicana]
MAPAATQSLSEALVAGHLGHLTDPQTEMLKKMWQRLFTLFEQPGDPNSKPAPKKKTEEAPKKSGGFFSRGNKEDTTTEDLFIGATTDPNWMSLPLEKAIPLIPGSKLEGTFWNMIQTDNPDAVVLRYLRARKWDFDAAYNMLINTLRWRLVNRVDDIVALGETGLKDELEKLKKGMGSSFTWNLKSGKAYLGGPDKDGRGICFINVRFHLKEDQSPEVVKLLTMYVMENSRLVVNQPMETACIVFNMEDFTLKNMDFDFVKFLVSCFEAYYPETLGQCLIHKAPWVFSTVWSLITPLLDPVVASKIAFTKNLDELTKRIDASALPSFISKDETKKTKDERMKVDEPDAGTLERPSTAAVQDYNDIIKEYVYETKEWTKTEKPADEKGESGRLELAKRFRQARVKADNDLRGDSTWKLKGMFKVNEQGRLIIDFGSDGWEPLDITDRV